MPDAQPLVTGDPTADLPAFYAEASAMSGRDRSLSMERIHIGPDALLQLPGVVADRGVPREVLVVMDDMPMRRAGEDLKELAMRLVSSVSEAASTSRVDPLSQVDPTIRTIVLSDAHGVHTTTEMIDRVKKVIGDSDVVVSVGSGTVTDITKHAVFETESATGRQRYHVAVATANSVGAYTSELAVVTTNGVKRTVPSRLPDQLVLDTTILADTPEEYALGGIGDGAVGWCSLGDYRLAALCGMGKWEPLAPAVFLPILRSFLRQDESFTGGGIATADAMARTLASAGFVMSFAGESAPASGLEHVTSHMLDMAAAHNDRVIGNHGEQCGLATGLVLLAYRYLLDEFDPASIDIADLTVDLAEAEVKVRRVFDKIDPTGTMSDECWRDYSAKCEAWNEHIGEVEALLGDWDSYREELRSFVAPPEQYLAALAATGHPLDFEDVPPGLPQDQVRWAFANARLMRRRLSVADFLGFCGLWTDDLVDRFFAEFEGIRSAIQENRA